MQYTSRLNNAKACKVLRQRLCSSFLLTILDRACVISRLYWFPQRSEDQLSRSLRWRATYRIGVYTIPEARKAFRRGVKLALMFYALLQLTSEKSDSLGPKLSARVIMGLFNYICRVPLCTNNFRNSPGLAFYRIRKVRRIQREYVLLLRNANLNLNCDSTRCILQVFLEVESPQAHLPSASHFYVFFFFQFLPPFCYFQLF